MKHLLILALFTNLLFGVTGNKVWRVPNGATLPNWGAVNLADPINAVTGLLPVTNLEFSGTQSSGVNTFTVTTSFSDVTGTSISFTSHARNVSFFLAAYNGTSSIDISSGTSSCFVDIALNIDGSDVHTHETRNGNAGVVAVPTGGIQFYMTGGEIAPAGVKTVKLRAIKHSACGNVFINKCRLVAIEH